MNYYFKSLSIIVLLWLGKDVLTKRYDEGPLINVIAVMEGKVLLPCNITTNVEDDQVDMIMFYHNNTGTPIYTVDMRGRKKPQAKHVPKSSINGRAKFILKNRKSGLMMHNVWSTDNGMYRCRVDFRKSPTRNSRVFLTVIVPPDSVRIVDEIGSERSSTIGPYVIGQTLALTCIAKGGSPHPKLTWYASHKPLTGQSKVQGDEVTNKLTISSLDRTHLHQAFICQASNDLDSIPVTAAVTIEMTLPPLSVSISGLPPAISAGVGVTATCDVIGARPSPVITWWLDGDPLQPLGERILDSGNLTVSTVLLRATREDQDSYLSCRAETPELLHAVKEDGVKIKVQYVPTARITVGPYINMNDIKQGDDYQLNCIVNAIPAAQKITWYYNGGIIDKNTQWALAVDDSLMIQRASRSAAGSYQCRAKNEEGEGTSLPIEIKIKFAPVCRSKQKLMYGAARNEEISVLCEIEAHPPPTAFQWRFNNSQKDESVKQKDIKNNWTVSKLKYTPRSTADYGNLICLSSNPIGKQKEPCVYKIFPAGPPEALKKCSILNETFDSVEVKCFEGFDGGLPQSFIMETFQTRRMKLKSNVTSKSASFVVSGLASGLGLTIRLYAANSKGRSAVTELRASTVATGSENYSFEDILRASELPSKMEFSPSFTIILGVIGGIMIVFVVIVTVMVIRRPRRDLHLQALHPDDSSLHILKKDDSQTGRMDGDEKDPDVIPEARGNRMECGDVNLSSVSTLYGEMITKDQPSSNHLTSSQIHNHLIPVTEPASCRMPVGQICSNVQHQPVITHNPACPISNQMVRSQMNNNAIPRPHPIHPTTLVHSCPSPHSSVIPPSYTQTLPHPRSVNKECRNGINRDNNSCFRPVTLSRRGSLHMDPGLPPIAPPPPYNTEDKPNLSAIVPLVGETIRIIPNATCGMNGIIKSPRNILPPTTFSTPMNPKEVDKDKLESSV